MFRMVASPFLRINWAWVRVVFPEYLDIGREGGLAPTKRLGLNKKGVQPIEEGRDRGTHVCSCNSVTPNMFFTIEGHGLEKNEHLDLSTKLKTYLVVFYLEKYKNESYIEVCRPRLSFTPPLYISDIVT